MPSGGLFGSSAPIGGGLFGQQQASGATSLFGGQSFAKPPESGSIFASTTSMFAPNQPNMFAGQKDEKNDGESSDGAYQDDQEEPPTIVELGEDVTDNSPFKKQFEKNADKFKIATPEAEKKNLG